MTRQEKMKHQRLLALFLLFLLLFNYPIISILNWPVLVAGVPLLYLYLFASWLLMILFLAWVVRRQAPHRKKHE